MMAIVVNGDACKVEDVEKAFAAIDGVDAVVSTIGGTTADPTADSQVSCCSAACTAAATCLCLAFCDPLAPGALCRATSTSLRPLCGMASRSLCS